MARSHTADVMTGREPLQVSQHSGKPLLNILMLQMEELNPREVRGHLAPGISLFQGREEGASDTQQTALGKCQAWNLMVTCAARHMLSGPWSCFWPRNFSLTMKLNCLSQSRVPPNTPQGVTAKGPPLPFCLWASLALFY